MTQSIMKQPMLDWSSKDKYSELRNFNLDISNMLQTLI